MDKGFQPRVTQQWGAGRKALLIVVCSFIILALVVYGLRRRDLSHAVREVTVTLDGQVSEIQNYSWPLNSQGQPGEAGHARDITALQVLAPENAHYAFEVSSFMGIALEGRLKLINISTGLPADLDTTIARLLGFAKVLGLDDAQFQPTVREWRSFAAKNQAVYVPPVKTGSCLGDIKYASFKLPNGVTAEFSFFCDLKGAQWIGSLELYAPGYPE